MPSGPFFHPAHVPFYPSNLNRHNERAKQLLRTEVAVMSRIRKLHHPNLMSFKHTFEVITTNAGH